MRVLFASTGAMGHFLPMAPLAEALRAHGAHVIFATSRDFTDRVEQFGFETIGLGLEGAALAAENQAEAKRRHALAGAGPPGRELVELMSWGRRESVRVRLDDLLSAVQERSIDLVVYEQTELAAPLVSAITGVPAVEHGLGVPPTLTARRLVGRGLAPLWRSHGLDPPPFGGFVDSLYINIRPPSLSGGLPTYPHVALMRPEPAGPRPTDPPWSPELELSGRPTAFVTLGTAFNEDEDQFRRILRGVTEAGAHAIVAAPAGDITERLRRDFPGCQIESFVPLSGVLPHCDLVVCNGGFGTTLGAAAVGLPMLFVTSVAGLTINARACADAGVGILLDGTASPPDIRSATEALLSSEDYRRSARAVAAEVSAMPPPEALVPLLVEIHRQRAVASPD